MRCSDVRDLLQPFLDGELEVDRNVVVLKHLELCPACRARSESENQLREWVARSARESLTPQRRQELIQGALSRSSGAWDPVKVRSPNWIVRLATAAAVLLLLTGGYVVQADPFCWWGCPTFKMLTATQQILDEEPLPIAVVEERIHRRIQAPDLVGPSVIGASYLAAAGMPAQPVVRYQFPEGQLCYFVVPSGHPHVGETRRLSDGREYVVLEKGSLRFVGWFASDGNTLEGCMPCRGLPDEELYLAAAALREARSL